MKRKGFTLIELLAVIVILAIIALIATPLVLKYIETSRIESFKVSVENIKDSALKYVASQQLEGKVTYPVIVDVKDLDFKGKEDYTGKVVVLKNGVVEEFIEKDNYRLGNSGFINKKSVPYLTFKEGYSGIIDEKNKLVYSFYNNDTDSTDYKKTYFNDILLQNIFEVKNGELAFEMANSGRLTTYSTNTKIILKDSNGNVFDEYRIVIFGDVDSDGDIDSSDTGSIYSYVHEISTNLTGAKLKAADLNRDGIVNEDDVNITYDIVALKIKEYNQITNKITEA